MSLVLIYLSAGIVTGFLSGVFGIGGGVIVVPVLLFAFALQGVSDEVAIHAAIASSMAVIVVTALSSVLAHWRRGNVQWRVVRGLAAGMVVGAFVGAQITSQLPAAVLQMVFGLFLLVVAGRLLFSGNPSPGAAVGRPLGLAGVGVAIGVLSSVVGIGGGSMTVPYLAWRGVGLREAVGTSAACGLPIAIAGTVGFLVAGIASDPALPPPSTGFIYWPAVAGVAVTSMLLAPVGAAAASRLPHQYLRRGFAGFLVVVAGTLLLG